MLAKKPSLFGTITFYTSILLALFTLFFLLVGFLTDYNEYQNDAQKFKNEHVKNIKNKLQWSVSHYVDMIENNKIAIEKTKKGMLKNRVNHALSQMSSLYNKYKDTKSVAEIQEIILSALREVRFPDHGYYFITRVDGIEILFDEKRELEGTNMLGLHNEDGIYVVQEMIELVKTQKEGFYNYNWIKPNNLDTEVQKISYIKLFEPFGWIVGTGIYEDDLRETIQKSILENIEQLKFDNETNSYIFIGQYDGLALTYPATGKNMYNVQDANGKYLVQELIQKAKEGGGFVEYVMPSLENEKNKHKVSYVEGFDQWQWYIGAGLYVDAIDDEIEALEKKLFEEYIGVFIYTAILATMVFILFLFFLRRVNAKIKADFSLFKSFFNELAEKNRVIDIKNVKFDEFENMALHANRMLDDKIKLQDYLEKYKTIVSTSQDFLSLIDSNYIYHAANETYLKYFEKSKEDIIGHSSKEIFGEEAFEKEIRPYQDRALAGESFMIEKWIDFPNSRRCLQVQYTPYIEENKENIEYFVVVARDITDTKFVEEQLKLWEKVFENTSEAVMVCDSSMNVVTINAAFTKITGYTKEEAIGQSSTFISFDAQTNLEFLQIINAVQKYGYWSGEVRNRRKNGEIYPILMSTNAVLDKEGNHANYVSIFSDITKLKESERKLEFLAHHDTLTNLPNRVLLNDRISHAIENAKRENSMVAVCFIDLDNFKKINDSFGHGYGDDVLKQTTKRIKASLRATDTLSRIGGDEFVLLLEHLSDIVEVEKIIAKVQENFVAPFISKNQKFFISASIGISLYPQNSKNEEELIKNADIAMYKAKDAGKNTYRFFIENMSVESYAVVDVENSLKEAISESQFVVYYQPQVNLKTKEVVGVEALIRWNSPQKGILPPSQFIKIAEDTKMIIPIGEFVLYQSCLDMVALEKEGIFNGKISINVSGVQIEHSDFLTKLQETIKKTNIKPSKIEVEITESVIMKDAQMWTELLSEMKKTGVKIAIDDFGTGYSSLSYLRKLPIDKLKIDMSFVRDLPSAEDACMIANSIITLSDNMKMTTLAEGIETIEQEAYLRDNNCEEGQGYLYAKPMNLEALKIWLKSR